jgi:PfaB family protein
VSKALADSDLFRSRIAGPQEAIREYWGLPKEASGDDLWRNYVLMTSPEAVRGEPDVYLTHINTPNQVVIGGRGSACLRLIERLRCNALEAPFRYALHCDPMRSERERLAALHDWPVMSEPLERLYTADGYVPLKIERAAIARSLAGMLVSPLDFVRLTNTVYQDGARIFIELGAGSNCSKWIGGTLKGQPHAALSLIRKGVSDYSALLGAVARLVGHRVPLRLEQVYGGSDGRMG